MKRIVSVVAALFLLFSGSVAFAAEWQFAVDVPGTKVRAWMWIPPQCERVRGLLIGQQVILEDYVMQHPLIRQAAADTCLAIVLLNRGALGEFDYKGKRDDLTFQTTLDLLAKESGYAEVATAPLLPIGHSGSAIWAWNIGYWKPSRTIAIIGLHAAAIHAPSYDPKATVEGVPFLGISGEYEYWGNPQAPLDMHWRWLRGTVLEFRGMMQRPLMSILVDPGGGHFSFNDPMAEYVALFLRSAVAARVPAQGDQLKEVPLESGWLTDITPLNAGENKHKAAPYREFSGEPSLAFWHLNKELALANESYRRSDRGKKDQRVTCGEDSRLLPAAWIEDLKFEPEGDGRTVKLEAGFLSTTPEGVAGSGVPLGHAAGAPKLKLLGGWFGGGEQVGPQTFRVRAGHLGLPDTLMVLAYHPGDTTYAYAEQACEVKVPRVTKDGRPQTIEFAKIADKFVGAGDIHLDAKATSGLPVDFYVVRGPAEVVGDRLQWTKLPSRTKMPVPVTVVAYQMGTPVGDKVQSAQPVEQTFMLQAR